MINVDSKIKSCSDEVRKLKFEIAAIKFEESRLSCSGITSSFNESTFDATPMNIIFRKLLSSGGVPTFEEMRLVYVDDRYASKLKARGINLSDNIPMSERISVRGTPLPTEPISYDEYATARLTRSYVEFIAQYYGYNLLVSTSRHVRSGLVLPLDSTALDLNRHDIAIIKYRNKSGSKEYDSNPFVLSIRMMTGTKNSLIQYMDKDNRNVRSTINGLATIKCPRIIDPRNYSSRIGDINVYDSSFVYMVDATLDILETKFTDSCFDRISEANSRYACSLFFEMLDAASQSCFDYNPNLLNAYHGRIKRNSNT